MSERLTEPVGPAQKGYGDVANEYRSKGWAPVPNYAKNAPVANATGKTGTVTDAKIAGWISDPRVSSWNVCLRAEGWIGVDVDDYDGKSGAAQLHRIAEILDGEELTDTYSSTSRGGGQPSRIRFYRVPEGLRFNPQPATDIEMVQHDHRYAVVYPSVHPKSGATYEWFGPDGLLCGIPNVSDLPELPQAYLDLWVTGHSSSSPSGGKGTPEDVDLKDWIDSLSEGEVTDDLRAEVGDFSEGRREPIMFALNELARIGVRNPERPGLAALLTEIGEARLHSATAGTPEADRFADMMSLLRADVAYWEENSAPASVMEWARERTATTVVMPPFSPDDFFTTTDKGTRGAFKPKTAANHLSPGLAIGVDDRFYEYENGVYKSQPRVVRARLGNALGDLMVGREMVERVDGLIRDTTDPPKLSDTLDASRIILQNTTYLWKEGRTEDHAESHRATVQLPITFDETAECPAFDAWLAKVVPADSVDMVWEALGYMLLPGNPLQKALLLYGPEGTGKSTFLRVLDEMLGSQNVSALSLRKISDGGFALAQLYGKLANICGDIDVKYLDDTGPFLQVTGQDPISTAHKYGAEFTFTAHAVPIFSANKMWKSSNTTESYFRRWTILPFPNRVKDTDPNFSEPALYAEAPGIFNKAMSHLRSLMARGKFEPSASATAIFDQFRLESDNVAMWLDDDSKVVRHEPGEATIRTESKYLWPRFQEWCQESNYKPGGKIGFNKQLALLGYEEKASDGRRFRLGISLDASYLGSRSVF